MAASASSTIRRRLLRFLALRGLPLPASSGTRWRAPSTRGRAFGGCHQPTPLRCALRDRPASFPAPPSDPDCRHRTSGRPAARAVGTVELLGPWSPTSSDGAPIVGSRAGARDGRHGERNGRRGGAHDDGGAGGRGAEGGFAGRGTGVRCLERRTVVPGRRGPTGPGAGRARPARGSCPGWRSGVRVPGTVPTSRFDPLNPVLSGPTDRGPTQVWRMAGDHPMERPGWVGPAQCGHVR